MNIHEYQAKELFSRFNITVPTGYLCHTAMEADFAFRYLASKVAVVKAQVHAGGRGKAGGVKLVKSAQECHQATQAMLGMNLITKQTGKSGKKVHKVYVEAGSTIAKEYYLALLVDRENAGITIMFSLAGGMDIEEVAAATPEKIATTTIDTSVGLCAFHCNKLIFKLNLPPQEQKPFKQLLVKLYQLFTVSHLSMLEINPLIVDDKSQLIPLDAKIAFDDNALWRDKNLNKLRDFSEEDAREVEASKWGLNYIGLEGNIGCLVNGAGLAMATMDIIKHFGGEPANFLDVGGGATEEMVRNAFRIIAQDPQVKAIFVNIFGGIMQCDIIAQGIVTASTQLQLKLPLIVRLEGTNVKQGKQILEQSKLDIITANDMSDGAQKAVATIKQPS